MKKRDTLSLFLVIFLILLMIMDSALILPNEVLIAADFDVYFDAIGLLIGVYTVFHGISILIFGYFTDKIQRKKLLIFSGFLWSITVIFYLFIEEFWQLMVGRIVAAIAVGVTAPLVISFLADVISSESRSKSFAFWGLLSTFAGFFAGFFALAFNTIDYTAIENLSIPDKIIYIITNYSDSLTTWRIPYFTLGWFALAFTLLNVFLTKEPKRAATEKYFKDVLTQENLQYSYKIKISDLKFIFKRKSNIFLILNFFDVIASGLLIAYIFPYIELEIGIDFIDIKVIVLLLIVAVFGLFIGQFGLAHWGDKKVQKGDPAGRVKVAVICSILTLPFLLFAFAMSPNVSSESFFFQTLTVNLIGFWILWIVYCSFLGVGLAFTMGIGPNWYASMIDVNFPENRGTMVAIASFIDTIGRALGAIIGGFVVTVTGSFSSTIFWSTLIFGLISIGFWLPLLVTAKNDFNNVNEEMKKRALLIQEEK
ncbi:MAG: MFS transporter [Promethearchaeota archaeon]